MSHSPVRVRFAPSPTGQLHIGGARTALFNFLFAKKNAGQFILRIDDTDRERSLVENERDILDSLRWLGLAWDEGPDCGGSCGPYRQSERTASYLKQLDKLLDANFAFRDNGGAVRLRYPHQQIVVQDLVCGECRFTPESLGPEPVLLRSDGSPTYHLSSVCDDIEMRISHVIRGQDHLTNSAKHQVLFEALGAKPPLFAHLPLILGEDGAKLSKRDTSTPVTVNDFRQRGYLAEALLNFLVLLGWSHPDAKDQLSMSEAIESFTLERVKRNAAIFEGKRLEWLNGWWIRHLDAGVVADRLFEFMGEYKELVAHRSRPWWIGVTEALRDGVGSLTEAEQIARLLFALELPLTARAQEFLAVEGNNQALTVVADLWGALLDECILDQGADCYDKATVAKLINQLKKRAGLDAKTVFHCLRILTTADVLGYELKTILPLITRDVLIERNRAMKAR